MNEGSTEVVKDRSPLQAAALRVQAAKNSEQELADLRARVAELEGRQAAPATAAVPPPPVQMTKEEKLTDLNRRLESSTSNKEIWELCAEIDRVRES